MSEGQQRLPLDTEPTEPAPSRPAPAREQSAAIADRRGDLFLAAGAGSGKTTVLVDRFCEVVCGDAREPGVGVENVLAFTFTDRAAGELIRRIRAELLRRAGAVDDLDAARRLRDLARDSESAWISTIHSFCRRVLAAHPFAAGLDPAFQVLDEVEAARLGTEAFDAAFRRFGERAGDDRFEMAAAFRVRTLREVVRAAHDELRAHGATRPALPALRRPATGPSVADLRSAATEALAALSDAGDASWVQGCRERVAGSLAGSENRVPSEEELAEWRVNSGAKALDLPEVNRYRDALALVTRQVVEDRFAHHYDYLGELVELYGEEYARTKDERAALDYEDLQLRMRDLLRSRPDLRDRYRRQFRHVMVDEFQDTNTLQLEIVRLLHEGEGGEARNRLFTVGDELQSIYGFRHADVEVFRTHRRAMEAASDEAARVRRLAGNFRSSPPVLAFVNHVGRTLFGGEYEELTMGSEEEPASDPAAEVLVVEREGWREAKETGVSADESAQPWRVAEARYLAGRLAELHRDGVPRGDMVVLLRSFSYVEAYEAALEAVGLAPYVVGGRGYWSKQQVSDVRNLLSCVANPLDDKALFGALASPACGVSSDALWLLRRAAFRRSVWAALLRLYGPGAERAGGRPVTDGAGADGGAPSDDEREAVRREREQEARLHIPRAEAEALRGFVARLLELRAEAAHLSLEALIDRTIGAFEYDLALLMRSRGRRRLANVRKLMRLAREFESGEGRDLRAFLDFVDAEVAAEGREAEAAVDAEAHDGVRIMTVHAAKGLEFPTVAVADLGRRLSAGFPPALRIEAPPPKAPAEDGSEDRGEAEPMRVGLRLARLGRSSTPIFDSAALEAEAVERDRREERRILHVAMTRARQRLILSGAFELGRLDDEPKDTDPLIATVLRALRWRGEGSVAVEAPSPRQGLGARSGAARVEIRALAPPDDETAAVPPDDEAALPDDEAAPAGDPQPTGRARPQRARRDRLVPVPLPDPELRPPPVPRAAPVRHVSYSALALYKRCGYRFYVERVLGLRPRRPGRGAVATLGEVEAVDPAPGDEWHTARDGDDLSTRYARGRVVHALLEQSAREAWARPSGERAAALLRREGAPAGRTEVERTLALVQGFLDSPLRRETERAHWLHAEAPFAFRAGELVVRGEIDLLADLGGEILLIDYKSDALGDVTPAEQMHRYEVQRRIYALAALRRYGRPVRVAYAFLERPAAPVEASFAPEDVPGLARELEAACGRIAARRFEVTDSPERPLCLDCPAREQLCVHDATMTLRERASP